MQALLDQAEGAQGAAGNAGLTSAGAAARLDGFRPLKVARIDAESSSVFSLTLAAADGAPLPAALPGQFLTFRLRPETAGPPVIRSYSMSGRPGSACYRISVKQEPRGVASGYLRAHLRVGDILDVAAPRGRLHPAGRRLAGPAGVRRHRRHPRPGHAARAGRRPRPA